MLWYLSVSPDGTDGKAIPVFMNENRIIRPLAGKRIWEAFLDKSRQITAESGKPIDAEILLLLTDASQEYAFDAFSEMKDAYDQKTEENYRKYKYALDLRIGAAGRIGIENIRRHKLESLKSEKENLEAAYRNSRAVCPDFHLELLVHME